MFVEQNQTGRGNCWLIAISVTCQVDNRVGANVPGCVSEGGQDSCVAHLVDGAVGNDSPKAQAREGLISTNA